MDKLSELFQNYQKEAFRFEQLPQYRVGEEWTNFQRYLRTGEIIKDEDLKIYLEEVKGKINSGATHVRARIVPSPLNNYVTFETKVGYVDASKLGVEFYFIDEKDLSSNFSLRDFWLFDKKEVIFFNYDKNGVWQGYDIGSEVDLNKCLKIRNLFISRGYGLEELISQLPQ